MIQLADPVGWHNQQPQYIFVPLIPKTQHLLLEIYLYNSNYVRHLATVHTKPLLKNKVNNIEKIKQKNHT